MTKLNWYKVSASIVGIGVASAFLSFGLVGYVVGFVVLLLALFCIAVWKMDNP